MTNNTLDELTETYAMLDDKKDPVGMDTFVPKTNDGWQDEKVATGQEKAGKEKSINRDMQP